MFPMHPDDVADIEALSGPSTWANEFATFEDACAAYGCDSPEQLAIEDREERKRIASVNLDAMETESQTLMIGVRQDGLRLSSWRDSLMTDPIPF